VKQLSRQKDRINLILNYAYKCKFVRKILGLKEAMWEEMKQYNLVD
jgi:hypothetical protein